MANYTFKTLKLPKIISKDTYSFEIGVARFGSLKMDESASCFQLLKIFSTLRAIELRRRRRSKGAAAARRGGGAQFLGIWEVKKDRGFQMNVYIYLLLKLIFC